MTIHNKLVRDRIPEIIEEDGRVPVTRVLDPDEYKRCLEEKLDEEVGEFNESKDVEELADILEVVFSLSVAQGTSESNLLDIYRKKRSERGGFEDRIFLIETE